VCDKDRKVFDKTLWDHTSGYQKEKLDEVRQWKGGPVSQRKDQTDFAQCVQTGLRRSGGSGLTAENHGAQA